VHGSSLALVRRTSHAPTAVHQDSAARRASSFDTLPTSSTQSPKDRGKQAAKVTATLAVCGLELGLSRERVRQLKEKAVAYCCRRGMAWVETIEEIAARFVGEPASCAVEAGKDVRPDPSSGHGTGEGASATIAGPVESCSPTPIPRYTRAEIGTMVAGIEGGVGQPLGRTTIARVLIGHPAPEVEALVAHHRLPHYGALKGLPRSEVGRLIAALRSGPTAPDDASPADTMPQLRRDATDWHRVGADDKVMDVAPLIVAIRAAVREPISPLLLSHILFGSCGPMVDALRERYRPPHDGLLRPLGIQCVLELVRAADRSSPPAP